MSQQEVSPPISQVVTRSEASHSHSSRRSRTSQAAAQARADAEAAYARARYAKRQIDMEVEKARIEATLHALKTEGEAEAALAAAKVWEATFEEEERAKVDLSEQGVFSKTPPSIRRAQEYVHAHFDDQRVQADGTQTPNTEHLVRHNDSQQPENSPKSAGAFPHVRHIDIADEEHLQSHRARTDISHQPTPSATPQSELSNLAAYLARRDLLTSGFKVFDNRPESYLSWKSMFCNATEGLNLKPSEELDLLTKWLGGESLQHAQRIRAVHVSNPQAGLQRLWQRLDKTYGSPEVIESSLFQRLQTFPRISNKDTHLLQELADLLLELSYAKSESYLPGLSFLDTPRGINPIVEKLPYGLQESWVTQGTKYKRENGAVYPPFSYFVRFVNDYAEMRTDPSFMLQCSNVINPRVGKTSVRRDKYRVPLAVNKIEISPAKLTALDPDKQCPIHQKPHSLVKCRGFRMKTLDERKNILKEHAICFKCCASTNHRARDCKAIIQCSECDSDAHVSAMHVGPPPWTPQDFNPPTQSHGGESEGPNPVNAASCTEVSVGAVAYLKLTNEDGHSEVGFLLGKARLAPKPDITIPRLELCAAVLAVEVAELVLEELDVTVDQLSSSTWLRGPAFLSRLDQSQVRSQTFDLIDPETDCELRPEPDCRNRASQTAGPALMQLQQPGLVRPDNPARRPNSARSPWS
ncbi:uncharacterized protein LOC130912137 [Corythoichthys intestinalis]|uniref:uncharacterized protein LOC130912137 n=1 Tax=Corythoichthys intestinalis TaxID=161448 RepID=UPI0025A664C8|nr:uncharacterized protein LOC130912137 [Corythoichthys intestinalis]